jgi:hypothetical protein
MTTLLGTAGRLALAAIGVAGIVLGGCATADDDRDANGRTWVEGVPGSFDDRASGGPTQRFDPMREGDRPDRVDRDADGDGEWRPVGDCTCKDGRDCVCRHHNHMDHYKATTP